jgi:hypothetical protein
MADYRPARAAQPPPPLSFGWGREVSDRLVIAPQQAGKTDQSILGLHPRRPRHHRSLALHPGEDLPALLVEAHDPRGTVEASGFEVGEEGVHGRGPWSRVAVDLAVDKRRPGYRRLAVRERYLLPGHGSVAPGSAVSMSIVMKVLWGLSW